MAFYSMRANKDLQHVAKLQVDYLKYRSVQVCLSKANDLPKIQLMTVAPDKNSIFPPILRAPFLCVNTAVKNALKKWEPLLVAKQIIVIDLTYKKVESYFLMIMEDLDCCIEKWKATPEHVIIDRNKLEGRKFFHVSKTNDPIYIVSEEIRNDLADYEEYIDFYKVGEIE